MSLPHSKDQHLEGGDTCNSEIGITFAGTMPSEAVASLVMIPGRYP